MQTPPPKSKLIDAYLNGGRNMVFCIQDPQHNMRRCLTDASLILHRWIDGHESRAAALDAIEFLEFALGYQVKRCTDNLRRAVELEDDDAREQLFAEAVAGIRLYLRRHRAIFAAGTVFSD
jgi:hypothetical protein